MSTLAETVTPVIRAIDDSRGYGTVRAVRCFADGRIEADISAPYLKPFTRRGRIVGDRVCFLGTTRVYRSNTP